MSAQVVCDHCPEFPHPLNDDGTECKRPRPPPERPFDVRFTVEMKTCRGNPREHHYARATRVKKEREAIALAWFRFRIAENCMFVPRNVLRLPRGISKADRALAKKTGLDLRRGNIVSWPLVPLTVELTRVSFGKLDDDGLRLSMKGVRDEIAWQLGLKNDRDPLVKWDYDSPGQEHGPAKYHAVKIRIRARDLAQRGYGAGPAEKVLPEVSASLRGAR